jgi:hypothetical protein
MLGHHLTALVGQSVFLLAAARLIGDGHFNQNGFVGVLLAMPLVACTMVAVRTLYIEDVLDDNRLSESF